MKTLLRRAAATGVPMNSLIKVLRARSPRRSGWKTCTRCKAACCASSSHPNAGPGLPRESAWSFWPRFAWETVYKHAVLAGMIGRLLWLKARDRPRSQRRILHATRR